MYTNILKDEILKNVKDLLNEQFVYISSLFLVDEILSAIYIVLENNIFTYSNTYQKLQERMIIGTFLAIVAATLLFTHKELNK